MSLIKFIFSAKIDFYENFGILEKKIGIIGSQALKALKALRFSASKNS